MGLSGRKKDSIAKQNASRQSDNHISFQISDYENQGFDFMQLKEIQLGIEAHVDVSRYADLDFLFLQMREIRLGLEAGLSVDSYASTEFDWLQMEQIRKGLEAGIDVTAYANSHMDSMVMKELRKGLVAGIDLLPYYEQHYKTAVLRVIRKSKEHGIDIKKYVRDGYDSGQLEQIEEGLSHGVDISVFLDKNLTGSQMCEIRMGAEAGIDVSVYARAEYNWMQMKEIRLGLEHGVMVFWYQDVNFSARQMREIRLGLEAGQEVFSYAAFIWSATDMQNMRLGRRIGLPDNSKLYEEPYQAESVGAEASRSGDITEGIQVSVSSDEMEAELLLLPPVKGSYTREDIMQALSAAGVKQGILDETIAVMVTNQVYHEPQVIAKGKQAVNGEDGQYEFFFRTELPTTPKILDSDAVDYQNIDFFEMVTKGQKIATYTPATNGVYGYTVTGKLIQPKKGKELPLLHGRGFEIQDGIHYYARIDGRIDQHGTTIEISPVYLHNGNVTLAVGNIRFNGDVHITGYVGAGVIVEADGHIVVDGQVEGALIKAGGSVLIRSGVNGNKKARIEAGGKIYGKFFEEATLVAEDSIETNYIMNCTSVSMNKIIVSGEKGSIVGGSSYAIKGVEAYNIGNQAEVKTYFELGKNEYYLKRQSVLLEKKNQIDREIDIFKQELVKYHRIYGEVQLETLSIYQNVKLALLESLKRQEEAEEELSAFTEDRYIAAGLVNLKVDGNAYAGCTVKIDGQKMLLESQVSNVVFKYANGRVAMYRNYVR